MNFELILILIFVICFTVSIIQCFEFIQNYDYIVKFNDQYSKYEYITTPMYNYIDTNYFDPNDSETNINMKWRCYLAKGSYYIVSQRGLGINDDNNIYESPNLQECISKIFSNYVIKYINPCNENNTNKYCNIFNNIKWNS
jgi:hypothetical protein